MYLNSCVGILLYIHKMYRWSKWNLRVGENFSLLIFPNGKIGKFSQHGAHGFCALTPFIFSYLLTGMSPLIKISSNKITQEISFVVFSRGIFNFMTPFDSSSRALTSKNMRSWTLFSWCVGLYLSKLLLAFEFFSTGNSHL